MLIYYDTNHARHYEPGKVYQHEDVYSRQPFMITMEDRLGNTSLWEKMQAEEIHYVLIEVGACMKQPLHLKFK